MTWSIVLAGVALISQLAIAYPRRAPDASFVPREGQVQRAKVLARVAGVLFCALVVSHDQFDLAIFAGLISLCLGGIVTCLATAWGVVALSNLGFTSLVLALSLACWRLI